MMLPNRRTISEKVRVTSESRLSGSMRSSAGRTAEIAEEPAPARRRNTWTAKKTIAAERARRSRDGRSAPPARGQGRESWRKQEDEKRPEERHVAASDVGITSPIWLSIVVTRSSSAVWTAPGRTRKRRVSSQQASVSTAMIPQVVTTGSGDGHRADVEDDGGRSGEGWSRRSCPDLRRGRTRTERAIEGPPRRKEVERRRVRAATPERSSGGPSPRWSAIPSGQRRDARSRIQAQEREEGAAEGQTPEGEITMRRTTDAVTTSSPSAKPARHRRRRHRR